MEKMKETIRWLAMLLLLCMVVTTVPAATHASVEDDGHVIHNIEITNATLSYQAGEAPKATATVSDSGARYEIDYENWQRMEEKEDGSWESMAAWYSDAETMSNLQENEKFAAFEMGKYYIYNIQLSAKDGYAFPEGSEVKMSLNGKEIPADTCFVQDNGSKLHVAWAAELGHKLSIIGDVDIEGVVFDYHAGDAPRAAAYQCDPYHECYDIEYEYWEEMEKKPDGTLEPVAFWYSDESKNNKLAADKKITAFEEGKTYMYSVSLKAKDLCSFSKDGSVMINNGKVNASNVTNSGTRLFVTAVKTIKPEKMTEPAESDTCASGHEPRKKLTKATMETDGKLVTQCSVCEKIISTEIIPKASDIRLSAVSYVYNGKARKPTVTIKDREGKTISAGNYSVSYANGRKNVGSYDVSIIFAGNYEGTATKSFIVKPRNVSIRKVTAGKKKIEIKWKKQTKEISGFQIQYATDKKFKKGVKTVLSAKKTTSKTITKLKSKKKYYVRIRSYKNVKVKGKNTKIYSSWSKAQKRKVK